MIQKLIETLGDKFFLLREKFDRALQRKQVPKLDAPARKSEPLSWSRLTDPGELRRLLNEYSLMISLAAVGLTGLALVHLYNSVAHMQPTMRTISIYYYDLKTRELFAGPSNQLPPVQTPSKSMIGDQPAGVRAHVHSCGACSDEKSRFISYLESFTPRGRALSNQSWGHVVRKGDMTGDWVSAASVEGLELVKIKCNEPNKFPSECLPGSK